ncbi:MAG: hypothetical protein IJO49_01990, partial [Clostridia bacterium]|nr:hypothetical protein [Clostridia bacterium]
SDHNYTSNEDKTWVINKPSAESISITFSADTYTEENWDFIYIYDGSDNLIGEYTGSALASKTITVQGDIVKISLMSDSSVEGYGFALVDISVKYAYTPGDIDGTGEVDMEDVSVLAKYLADWEVECNQASLDVNGDRAVNLKDLVYLSQILAGLHGDSDANGEVDIEDVSVLSKYLAGWDVDCNEAALDVSGDGVVNLFDLVYLSQYVAGWDVTLH